VNFAFVDKGISVKIGRLCDCAFTCHNIFTGQRTSSRIVILQRFKVAVTDLILLKKARACFFVLKDLIIPQHLFAPSPKSACTKSATYNGFSG